jgi:lysophospholipase L1-like esterase
MLPASGQRLHGRARCVFMVAACMQFVVSGALLVAIFFGANDAALPEGTSRRQHVPLALYKHNLESMVEAARQAGARRVVLLTPPPVHEAARVQYNRDMHGNEAKDTPERTNEVTGEYADACRQVQLFTVPAVLLCMPRQLGSLQQHCCSFR